MEHEQGYESICSIGEDQRGWIKEVISGSGWAWAWVRGGENSLSYRRGRGRDGELVSGFTFWWYIYGSKVVILEEDTDVEVGIGVGV